MNYKNIKYLYIIYLFLIRYNYSEEINFLDSNIVDNTMADKTKYKFYLFGAVGLSSLASLLYYFAKKQRKSNKEKQQFLIDEINILQNKRLNNSYQKNNNSSLDKNTNIQIPINTINQNITKPISQNITPIKIYNKETIIFNFDLLYTDEINQIDQTFTKTNDKIKNFISRLNEISEQLYDSENKNYYQYFKDNIDKSNDVKEHIADKLFDNNEQKKKGLIVNVSGSNNLLKKEEINKILIEWKNILCNDEDKKNFKELMIFNYNYKLKNANKHYIMFDILLNYPLHDKMIQNDIKNLLLKLMKNNSTQSLGTSQEIKEFFKNLSEEN